MSGKSGSGNVAYMVKNYFAASFSSDEEDNDNKEIKELELPDFKPLWLCSADLEGNSLQKKYNSTCSKGNATSEKTQLSWKSCSNFSILINILGILKRTFFSPKKS